MTKKGFTLIELLLVMAIVLALAVLAGPFYSRFLGQNAVANTTDQIVQSLRKAQFYAMMSRKSESTGWGVNYGSFLLTVYQGNSYVTRNQALDEKFEVNSSLNVTSFDVNFARVTGLPNSTPSIAVVGKQGTTESILVNSLGRVTR